MGKRTLITGGAGFTGTHVADELLLHGHSVRERVDGGAAGGAHG